MFTKWRTILALIPLVLAIVLQWWWFFSLLFIIQIGFSLWFQQVDYVEPVRRDEHPGLYWLIIGVWVFLAVYSVLPYLGVML